MEVVKKNQRDTRQRRIIYEDVMHRRDHPTADDIYLSVRALDSKISRGTVYRNLKLLADNGDILRVILPGADRFDSTLCSHDHIICRKCASVVDAPLDYSSTYDELVQKATNFQITMHWTTFSGICPACQKAEDSKSSENISL